MEDTLKIALEREKTTLEAKRQELEQEIARLEKEKEAVSFRLGHVTALLRGPEKEEVREKRELDLLGTLVVERTTDPVEIAHQYLEEHGTEPVHYRKLADVVKEKGGELEGTDPAITLVSRLVADDRFVRPFRRGWYSLRAYYPKARSVGSRKKRKGKPVSRR
jgi:hypothetical protein